MFSTKSSRFNDIFGSMEDPRIARTRLHPMENILFISLCAVICGAETWNEIEDFGHNKFDWLSRHLDMPNGIPSHDTFNRFFSALEPDKFEECFRNWVSSLDFKTKGDVISIDGKTIKGSAGHNRNAIHMVSAWSRNAGITLGQLKTPKKIEEITVIPNLLEALFIEGAVITIDAIGCNSDIADKIVSEGGDYVLQVKKNQEHLLRDIEFSFEEMKGFDNRLQISETNEDAHGRLESRTYTLLDEVRGLRNPKKWHTVKSFMRVEKTSFNKTTSVEEKSTRYYITTLSDVKKASEAIRSHWGIENNLHWMLDVAFDEDRSRKHNQNAVVNFSMLNKMALSALSKEDSVKMGVKSKRLKAAMNDDYLMKLLSLF